MCGILHSGGKQEDSICVFICLYGNIYTNPNVILCLNIYLVVGNTVHNEIHENKLMAANQLSVLLKKFRGNGTRALSKNRARKRGQRGKLTAGFLAQ